MINDQELEQVTGSGKFLDWFKTIKREEDNTRS